MRKIINGKAYDTDTATLVGEYESGNDPLDRGWYQEALYRKRTGEYFVWGEGGASSKYARSTSGDWWSGGEEIVPMTYERAVRWAEEHLGAEAYEAEFGEVPEDDSKVMVGVRVSAAAKAALDRRASETGRTRSEIVEELLLSI